MKTKRSIGESEGELAQSLATSGLRFTRQRKQIFEVVHESFDHPTAEEVFERAKSSMPEISLATVYNCLDVLVDCGLVRQVNLERGPARFCPNRREHCHFHCQKCGEVTDIYLDKPLEGAFFDLPAGFMVDRAEVALTGQCAKCAKARK